MFEKACCSFFVPHFILSLSSSSLSVQTTIAGLTGSHPDYAFVIINSLAGVTKMTREHLGVVLALEIPLICIVTKVSTSSPDTRER
jgi:GTPase